MALGSAWPSQTTPEWHRLCDVLDAPALADDPRYAALDDRRQHVDALDADLARLTGSHDAEDLAHRLRMAGVPATKSATAIDVIGDQQLWDRELYRFVSDHREGQRPILGPSWRMTRGPARIERGAPDLGEDTDYVLHEILGRIPNVGRGMTGKLTQTAALVTGASSGIGAATALALAAQGAAVALLARRAERLADLKTEIESAGGTALVLPADVTDAEQVASAVQRTVAELGRLDILVNNAGLMQSAPADQAPLGDWDQMVAVNVQGVLYATRAALPHLIEAAADSGRGVADVVTISSTAGWVARPNTAVYSLTKFGVNAFSEGLRQEVLGKRVRVGVVGPGTVDTEIFSHLAESSREAFERQTAGMVKLRPEDIADAVLFMVTRDRRVAVNHMLVRAAEQTW